MIIEHIKIFTLPVAEIMCENMRNTFVRDFHMQLSPAAAARIAGVSRSLISKEVKAGKLIATVKNGNGHIAILEADLRDWMERRVQRNATPRLEATDHTPDPNELEELKAQLSEIKIAMARLEGQAEANAARITDLAADRDAWKAQAERLASETRPINFWDRIFKR